MLAQSRSSPSIYMLSFPNESTSAIAWSFPTRVVVIKTKSKVAGYAGYIP